MPQELEKKPEIGAPKPELPPEPEEVEAIPGVEVEPLPVEKEAVEAEVPSPAPAAPPTPPAVPKKDPTTMAVEKILEEDLGDLYVKLDPQTRKKFQDEGDKLVFTIRGMVDSLKVQGRKVVRLIREWLKIIPGINKYFLEQEAKIKTDKIIELSDKEKQKRQGLV